MLGSMVGVSQQAVSALMREGKIPAQGTVGDLLLAYCERMRAVAAARASEEGGVDLVQERALLAREQRIGQAHKNAVARGEYAPIGVLADVLAEASSAVVDRFDQLDGMISKACPDLPDEVRTLLQKLIASARNEWIRATDKKVLDRVDAMVQAGEDDAGDEGDFDDAAP